MIRGIGCVQTKIKCYFGHSGVYVICSHSCAINVALRLMGVLSTTNVYIKRHKLALTCYQLFNILLTPS